MPNAWPAISRQYAIRGVFGMSPFIVPRKPLLQNNLLNILNANYAENRRFTFLPKPGQQGATLTVGGDYQGNGGGIVNLANIVNLPYTAANNFYVRKFFFPLRCVARD